MSQFKPVVSGAPNSLGFKQYMKGSSGAVSLWHDIPLYANAEKTLLNMVVEIPRWSNAKLEISKEDKLNPIIQDTKKGKLRFVHNIFPHKGYIWNYGAFPQTYEDPEHVDKDTGCKGDCDPLDVIEIGSRVKKSGEVIQVKVLGLKALLDEGETDWKIVAIDAADPMADKVNDIEDVETHFPGLMDATYEWFTWYKVPAGKPLNDFAFNGASKDKAFAMRIVEETYEAWKNLLDGKTAAHGSALESVTYGSKKISQADADAVVSAAPAAAPAEPIADEVDAWHHVIKK
eukprot:Nk52_evm65s62 gene=Nk52_evmTU65s62